MGDSTTKALLGDSPVPSFAVLAVAATAAAATFPHPDGARHPPHPPAAAAATAGAAAAPVILLNSVLAPPVCPSELPACSFLLPQTIRGYAAVLTPNDSLSEILRTMSYDNSPRVSKKEQEKHFS